MERGSMLVDSDRAGRTPSTTVRNSNSEQTAIITTEITRTWWTGIRSGEGDARKREREREKHKEKWYCQRIFILIPFFASLCILSFNQKTWAMTSVRNGGFSALLHPEKKKHKIKWSEEEEEEEEEERERYEEHLLWKNKQNCYCNPNSNHDTDRAAKYFCALGRVRE